MSFGAWECRLAKPTPEALKALPDAMSGKAFLYLLDSSEIYFFGFLVVGLGFSDDT